ncbi:pilus assembly protein [Micromonospora sp. AMSO1212t]|uniref:TadE-like protein n=1 Tax=Micromonospora tulbaghiae TaxID=479978 RepID=A0ABY0KFE3_9ACTN|nr:MULTISPECIES: TadE/TadG family type IV pilus assembly protein [Micromonospora]KAB1909056.1 pilus assembly protein [Micromonospora sp. AMSO1212t]MDX5460331.1 pilus assembly protein [Micromonospora tulbaghiae]SCE65602.1 TadE-like protein [Micromonospora tulbaghiae]
MPRPARTVRSRPASAGRPAGPPGPGRFAAALRARLAEGERGANPVELAVVMPVILVMLFGSIQVAVWFVARSTALNAAQTAVNAQRTIDAGPDAGRQRAISFLQQAGDWLVGWEQTGPTCVETATGVTCTVQGRSLSVIPGVSFEVTQTAHGPAERWTTG